MPDTCRLYLVRHGEVPNPNHIVYGDLPGFHLSPAGVQQAYATGRHLGAFPLDVVLTSPLARAVETATAITRHHGVHPTVEPRLTESGQFPHWTGIRWESIPSLFPGELESYLQDAEAAGGTEELAHVAQRYVSVVDDAVASGHNSIVVVGHQDPLQAARLLMTGRDLGELRHDPPNHGEVVTLIRSTPHRWAEESRWSPESPTS